MTTKSKLLQRQQALQAELDKLNETIRAMPEEKPVGRSMPEDGQEYWYIDSGGEIYSSVWDGHPYNRARWSLRNVFPTREAAERALDRQLVHAELQDLADEAWAKSGKVLNWMDRSQFKHHIVWGHVVGEYCIGAAHFMMQSPNTVYFPTEESLRAAVEKTSEKRIELYCKGE